MSGHRIAAITRRLLQGFRRDRRTLALLFVAPLVILGLLGYMLRNSSTPAVGVNEDSGPLGAWWLRHWTSQRRSRPRTSRRRTATPAEGRIDRRLHRLSI